MSSFAAFGQLSNAPAAGRQEPSVAVGTLVSNKAQIAPVDVPDLAGGAQRSLVRSRRCEVRVAGKYLTRPPCAKRVVQQEEDHVVLGEELCDSRQFVCADLDLRLVDLVFLVRLPELVDPAEAVIRLEDRLRQTLQQVLHFGARFWRQRDL